MTLNKNTPTVFTVNEVAKILRICSSSPCSAFGPWLSDRSCSRKDFIQPSLSVAVKRNILIDCIHQQTDVGRNHLGSANLIFRIVSVSSSSSATAKAFVKWTSGGPIEHVFCTKRLAWSLLPAPGVSAARTASLRARSSSAFRLRTSQRSSSSTIAIEVHYRLRAETVVTNSPKEYANGKSA